MNTEEHSADNWVGKVSNNTPRRNYLVSQGDNSNLLMLMAVSLHCYETQRCF
jgi:hypothetical protein